MAFGHYKGERQIGFARVAIDGATFAYIGYMFVLGEWRGRGLGAWIVECVTNHPDLGPAPLDDVDGGCL